MYLLIGDPHFEVKNLPILKKAFNEIIELIEDRKPKICIILGDTLHTHEKIHLIVLTEVVKIFKKIAERCRLIVLIGNHDRINNRDFLTDTHPFTCLDNTPNITIVNKTYRDPVENIICVPYVPPGRFMDALNEIGYTPGKDDPDAIFAHQEFKNCDLGGVISTQGDYWDPSWPKIYSGHIHKYHILKNIVYVGTFHQQNFGEDTDKAVMFTNGDRVRIKSCPIKKTVIIDEEDEIPIVDENTRVIINVSPNSKKKYKGLDKVVLRYKKQIPIQSNTTIKELLANKLNDDEMKLFLSEVMV